jgi:hypothetical protein
MFTLTSIEAILQARVLKLEGLLATERDTTADLRRQLEDSQARVQELVQKGVERDTLRDGLDGDLPDLTYRDY